MNKWFRQVSNSSFLLFTILLLIFGSGLLEYFNISKRSTLLLYSLIFIGTYFSIKKRTWLIKIALLTGITLNLILFFIDNFQISLASYSLSVAIFIAVTFVLIHQIAKAKKISDQVLLEAINGYLLIGVISIMMNSLLYIFDNRAIGFSKQPEITDFVYYSFINLTTIGFGDISPVNTAARLVSIFTGMAGQLYLAIIIALIISKVSTNKKG